MRTRLGILLLFITTLLAGCATPPQQPVALSNEVISSKSERIGVVMAPLPQADTQFPGAGCLLCLAAASIANSSLTSHTKTLPSDDLLDLKKEIVTLLQAKGLDAVEIPGQLNVGELPDFSASGPNVARKDHSSLRQKYAIDRLVVIDVKTLGFLREYSAYVPTGAPKATLIGIGYMVNLKTNTYDWYKPVHVQKSSDATWDEPPKFPGLTNAYFQALEIAKDGFRQVFTSNLTEPPKQASGIPTQSAAR